MKVGLYARVSTHDQQTLALQCETMAAYVQQRAWEIAVRVEEIGSGASERGQRETLMRAARRRAIDAIVVWRLDRWGRSLPDLVGTLHELQALGVGFISLSDVLCQKGLPVRQKGLPFRLPETQTASRRAPGSAENPRQHVNIRGGLLHRAACFCPKKPLCQKGWPRLSESLAARNNIRGIFAPKNARNMPPFSRQRFMANLCPTAHLSGNALLRCDTTHKAKNSFNALYKNELDGENLSSDLRQTFVASTANLPDKAQEGWRRVYQRGKG
jgi:Resolvase, N terminal domain